MRFLHSISTPEQTISADGVYSFDLAVNPLSVVLLVLRPLNDTGTLANHQRYLNVCKAANRVTVMHQGRSVYSMRGEDAAALNWMRHGILPWEANSDNVDNERRAVVLPLLMGRHAYSAESCLPATRRGELKIELDLDIADTGYDGLRLSIETIELPGAKPREFERKVAVSQTFAATGDADVDLPPGNLCRGMLLFGTTPFGGAAPAPSWGRVKTLLDNREIGFSAADWEVLQMLPSLWGRQPPMVDHKHTVNAAGAGIEETASVFDVGSDFENYAFLDFDPTQGGEGLDTKGASRFHVRADVETADAVRVVPVEVIMV